MSLTVVVKALSAKAGDIFPEYRSEPQGSNVIYENVQPRFGMCFRTVRDIRCCLTKI